MRTLLLFLVGCMGTRLALVYLAATTESAALLRTMGYLALGPAIGFFVIYAMGWRKTGPETLGAPIWWNALRPVHGALWATFAVLAILGRREWAWRVLLADLALGLAAWALFRLPVGTLCSEPFEKNF